MLNIRAFKSDDESAVVALWESCGLTRPWNDPRKDIRRKLQAQPASFLVGLLDDEIVASVMAGYDGHRGWINYLAVSPAHQGQGLGTAIMTHAEQLLQAEGCPKINMQIRSSNTCVIEFYRRLGFTMDDVVCMGKRIESDLSGQEDAASR